MKNWREAGKGAGGGLRPVGVHGHGQTEVGQVGLCEGKAGLVVHLEDLLDGVHVGCRPQVQAQVVLVGRAHDLLKGEKPKITKSDL